MRSAAAHRISSVVLGLLFLVSAFAKAWNADVFGQLLLQYGPRWFGVLAPIIIFCEVVLGMCLLLRVRPKQAAIAADVFLVTVSAVFAYGVFAKGIHDCGCFGALDSFYDHKPWMTFVRNAVLMVLTLPILFTKQEKEEHLPQKLIAMILVSSVVCFVSGIAMHSSFRLPRLLSSEREDTEEMMAKLDRIYPFSADSSYIVYLFSFTCPYCQTNYANVAQYQQFGLADKVLGIAEENEEAQARFERIYRPQIAILTIPHDTMSQITHRLPVLLHIEGGEIQDIESGIILSPGLFIE